MTRAAVPVLLMLGSVVSLQVGAALAITLFDRIGSAATSSLRLSMAAAVLLVLARPRVRAWTCAQWWSVTLFGLALGGMNWMFYEAISRIPLGLAVAIQFLGPLGLAAVLSRRWREGGWVLLALSGVLLFGLQDVAGTKLDPIGIAVAVVAAAFWALYVLAGGRVAGAGVGFGGLAIATAVAALVTLPAGVLSGGLGSVDGGVLVVGAGVALLATVIPYSLEFAALGRLSSVTFSVLLALEPAAAGLAGALLLGQSMTVATWLAIALVVAAGAGSTISAYARRLSLG